MRRTAVGVVLALLTAAVAPAQPPDAGRIMALVAQLGSDDYRAREAAGKALLAHGDRALPALKAALNAVEDPEAHRRVEVIVQRLEAERLVTPRRVTLKASNKSPKDVVAQIARQTGYAIELDGAGDDVKLSLDLADVPFWEAVDRVCIAAGLSVNQTHDETGALHLYFNDCYDPHVSYWGPFRVVADHVSSSRDLKLSGLPRRAPNLRQPEHLHLNFDLFAEPKAEVLGLGQPVLTKATDDTGASLLLPQPPQDRWDAYYPSPVGFRSFNHGFGVMLHRVSQRATAIRELRGRVPVILVSEARPEIVVADVLTAKGKRFAGRTVDLEVVSVEYANDALSLELTARRKHGDPDDWHWLHVLPQRLEVTDTGGGKYAFNGVFEQNVGQNLVTYQMQFANRTGKKLGKPSKLQLVEWVTVTRDVEFAFKDIPLP
jgi:hypothetical protein